MTEERNLGATEARIGLTLIIGLLVTLGFVIVHRLGDSPRPTSATPALPTYSQSTDSDAVGVRTALGIPEDKATEHQTSYAPQWLEPQSPQPGDRFTR